MKKVILFVGLLGLVIMSFTTFSGKLVSNKNHIRFFSHTSVEDIEANNYSAISTIDKVTGDVVFSVPMQSFQFDKALMQKHFNSKDFLDTKKFPKSKLVAKISNIQQVNFAKDGIYNVNVVGDLTIKETTKKVNEKGVITVKSGKVSIQSTFKVILADYGIVFEKGKPSSNVSKEVEITVEGEYTEQ